MMMIVMMMRRREMIRRRRRRMTRWYDLNESSFYYTCKIKYTKNITKKHDLISLIVIICSYAVYSESIETEAVFIKSEMNNEWNINFLQNSSPGTQHTYSSEFSIGWNTSKTPLLTWYFISFNVLHILKSCH